MQDYLAIPLGAPDYPTALHWLTRVRKAVGELLAADGPSFLHMRIAPGSMAKLGRPTVKPPDVARRFRDFLAYRNPEDDGQRDGLLPY